MMYFDIIGRLGMDSELRTSKNGKQYLSMRVATNDYIGGENITTWVNVMWAGERAIKMHEHLKKGSSVIVRGTPKFSMYPTKDGDKAISIDVFADRVDFSNPSSGSSQSSESSSDVRVETVKQKPKVNEAIDVESFKDVDASTDDADEVDDLPF